MPILADSQRSRPRETVTALFNYPLPNCPGKVVIGAQVNFPPGGWTPPHTHAGATVVARVTHGEVLSGMNGDPPKVYHVGDTFMERPGCHHTVSDNNSDVNEAGLMVTYVVDGKLVEEGGQQALLVIDEEYR